MKKSLKIFGQIIVGIIILCIGISLINFSIPGHRNFCDADQIYMFYFGLIFTIVSIGFLINSIIFYKKKQWTKYRIIAISLTLLLALTIFSTRSILTKLYYGKITYEISNEEEAFTLIKIRLFQNNKFISETYNLSCNVENIGTYELTNNKLTFRFKGDKSKYLETQYRLTNDTLTCIDCEKERRLIMKKN